MSMYDDGEHSEIACSPEETDICSIPDMPNWQNAHIIHCAALMKSETDEEMFRVNVTGTVNMLHWAKRNRARSFVFLSSGSVYGYSEKNVSTESAPINPIGIYGHTKFIGERLCEAFCALYKFPAIVLRLFFPYGSGQKRGIIPYILSSIANGSTIHIKNGGEPLINPIHINDVVDAIWKLIRDLDESASIPRCDCFNLSGDETVSFLQIVRTLEDAMSISAKLEPCRSEERNLLADNSRLKAKIEWSPTNSIETWIHSELQDSLHRQPGWTQHGNEKIGR